MTGFSFPPPPPPPPKAASDWNGSQNAQYGSQNRGGRGRSRGRGGQDGQGRGRGSQHPGTGNRFGNAHQHGGLGVKSSPLGNGNATYGVQPPLQNPYQQLYHQSTPAGLPPGAYVNPSFAQQPPVYGNDYNKGKPSNFTQSPCLPLSSSPPRTLAGHKRKLDALRPPPEPRPQPGPQAAPAIPSFGTSILPPKSAHGLPLKPGLFPRPASNALGLTPAEDEPQYPSSDEEADDKDVDEEALHAELGASLTFEHNGVMLSLKSTADIAAWQEERRRNWPTRARMSQKEAERRQIGEERKRLLGSAAVLNDAANAQKARNGRGSSQSRRFLQGKMQQSEPSEGASVATEAERKPESNLEKARRELAIQGAKLEALRRRVTAGEAFLAKARVVQEEHDFEVNKALIDDIIRVEESTTAGAQQASDVDDASNTSSEVLSDSSVLSPGSSADQDSDDDGPPEELTSRVRDANHDQQRKPPCRYFVASGYCRDGETCRFRHELAPRGSAVQQQQQQQRPSQPRPEVAPKLDYSATADKKSIYQRLMEQQQEEEDRLALRVIKHLGKAGFFSAEPEAG